MMTASVKHNLFKGSLTFKLWIIYLILLDIIQQHSAEFDIMETLIVFEIVTVWQ